MDNSPFGKLPAEIRSQIYSLAMPNAQRIEIVLTTSVIGWCWGQDESDKVRMCDIFETPAFTRTCKQFFEESTPLFYNNESFVFYSFYILEKFVKAIGNRNAKSIRSAMIDTYNITYVDPSREAPLITNAIARERLSSALDYAKQYGWISLRLNLTFRAPNFYAQRDFDLLQPGKEWGDLEVNGPYKPTQASDEVDFRTTVEDQIQV